MVNGSVVQLHCSASLTSVPGNSPNLMWFRNDSLLSPDPAHVRIRSTINNTTMTAISVLTVDYFSVEDEGIYSCVFCAIVGAIDCENSSLVNLRGMSYACKFYTVRVRACVTA